MKLYNYKDHHDIEGNCITFKADKPATLYDLKDALKERGMVAVPAEEFRKLVRAYEDDFDDALEHRPNWVSEAMIKAAEEGND